MACPRDREDSLLRDWIMLPLPSTFSATGLPHAADSNCYSGWNARCQDGRLHAGKRPTHTLLLL